MAMGNYCFIQGIECPYARSCGDCLDDIYDEYGLCEMLGDDMPPRQHRRAPWAQVDKVGSEGGAHRWRRRG